LEYNASAQGEEHIFSLQVSRNAFYRVDVFGPTAEVGEARASQAQVPIRIWLALIEKVPIGDNRTRSGQPHHSQLN
jgi:hypothetical protein